MPKISEMTRILQEKGPLSVTDLTFEYVKAFISDRKVDDDEFFHIRDLIGVYLSIDKRRKQPRFKHIVTHRNGIRGVWAINPDETTNEVKQQ